MSTADILKTKLYIPHTRPELVPRPRLIGRLNESLHRKLTLISAPAGFGKTTLVSDWVDIFRSYDHKESQVGNRVGWISLDEGDNDQVRFIAHIIAALNHVGGIEATIGEGALSMLQSPQPPVIESILTSLINELDAVPGRIILVLDDYHLIDAPSINYAISFTLEHLPSQMHLVIITREDPQLPLARLRARNQLFELRATDLRFTFYEAAKFLNQVMGLDLSVEDIAALDSRTEGWIAGLQLAAISMQGHQDPTAFIKSFTGSHHFVLDYLVEEVLEKQSECVQSFLMRTSILDRLTGSLCDALTDQEDGQATLEFLENHNLFIIPMDGERRWYRYHHLFIDLLHQRLCQTHPDDIPTLHHRASQWYEQAGCADKAIEHALRSEDFERAASLIEEHIDAIWQRGEHNKLRLWLDGLPVELMFSKPHLCILHAWDMFTAGQQEAAERSLQAAEQALTHSVDRPSETTLADLNKLNESERMILGRVATIRAFLAFYRGDVQDIRKFSLQALEYLPEQDLTWRSTATVALGDAYSFIGELDAAYRIRLEALEKSKTTGNFYMILIASMKLAVTLRQQGRLKEVREICHEQLQLANESGLSQAVVVGWLLAICGETLAELNELDEALDQTKKGVELTEQGKDLAMIGWSYLCLMRVLYSRGDLEGAEKIIRKMENITQKYHVPPWIIDQMAAWQGRIWLAQNKLETASQWITRPGLDPEGDPTYMDEVKHIALARILIAQGRLDETTPLLQRLLKPAEARGHTSRVIEILILQAMVFQARGDAEQAMTTLERALTLAESGGLIRTFVDEGPPMARLLYEAHNRGIATDYVRGLLAAFPIDDPVQADKSELIEPLSERELEVLQHIAEGLTNREIATRLYLSLNTIKVHTRNIYGKLGVNNRTQAVSRARDLGVLHSF